MDAGDVMPGLDRSCRGNGESTPPDIAASTFIGVLPPGKPQVCHGPAVRQPRSRAAVQSNSGSRAAVLRRSERHASRL